MYLEISFVIRLILEIPKDDRLVWNDSNELSKEIANVELNTKYPLEESTKDHENKIDVM